MKGLVFTEFLELVEQEFGIEIVDKILSNPALSNHGSYTSVGNYPHSDILHMVGDLSESVGLAPKDLVFTFGKYLFHQFATKFPSFFEGKEDALNFLEGIESVIHTEVRKLYEDAILPTFECKYETPDELHMEYQSQRPMADLAEGLIMGCIEHFGNQATLQRIGESDPYHSQFIVKRS